jgi:hypothetical protein
MNELALCGDGKAEEENARSSDEPHGLNGKLVPLDTSESQ